LYAKKTVIFFRSFGPKPILPIAMNRGLFRKQKQKLTIQRGN